MKKVLVITGVGLILLSAGCASVPVASVALAPVGPNPMALRSASSQGSLEVFSRLSRRSDDLNQGSTYPVWYQHTDYYVCNLEGKVLKHVFNATGHYEQDPKIVNLPAGKYLVMARSTGDCWVKVPVTIDRGEITWVHLADNWTPPSYAEKAQIVKLPDGKPVGWGSEL